MSVILIIMMIPSYVSAEDIPLEESGIFLYRIRNESNLHGGKALRVETSFDYSALNMIASVPVQSGDMVAYSVTTNATTSSIIKVTVDVNDNGSFESDELSSILEVPAFDSEITQIFDITIADEYIAITPRQYQDYSVVIKDVEGNTVNDVYSYYDPISSGMKRLTVYIPDSGTYKIGINGINEENETPVPISYGPDNDNFQYDVNTDLLTVGELGEYESALLFGNVHGNVNLTVIAYRDKLGLLEIKTPDGEPFTGETRVFSETLFTGHGNVSLSSDYLAYEGILPILIRDDYVGVDYAYLVISPENTEMTNYANTPFLDITSKLNSVANRVVDLGSISFQTPSYTGYVYRSDDVTPVSETHVSVTTAYTGDQLGLDQVYYVAANGSGNEFYIAPLGEDFSNDLAIRIMKSGSDFKTIDAKLSLSETEGRFVEPRTQLIVTMNDDSGALLPDGIKSIQAIIFRDDVEVGGELGRTQGNQLEVGGFEEGDLVTLWFNLNTGSFDHMKLYDSSWVTFEYTDEPGNYFCTDKGGNTIHYTVDAEGVMHLSLKAQKSQLFGRVKMGDSYVQDNLYVKILDPETRNLIAWGSAHPAFIPDSEILNGVISIAHDFPLEGEYIISVEDPKDTIYYTGTEFKVTFPLTQDLIIELPESRAFGKIKLSADDETTVFDRVYVNIFDENSKYIKNARVRDDGYFSAGELFEGKYFAKVFVSPYSGLSARYATSKMHMFELDSTSNKVEFLVPLVETIGKGTVYAPDMNAVTEAWVNIINVQGTVVESVKTNGLGEFSIPALKDGKYTLKALGSWGYFDSLAQAITISDNTITGSTTLKLTEAQLFGAIYDDMNELTSGTVYIYDAQNNLVTTTYSFDGYYATGGFVNGNYFIQVKPDNSSYDTTEMIPFTQDDSRNWQDISIVLKRADYSGRIFTVSETPVTKGWVHLYKDLSYVKSVSINEDGSYSIGGIDASGSYTFMAESQGQWSKMMPIGDNKVNDITLETEQVVQGVLKLDGDLFSKGNFVIYDSNHVALVSSSTNAFGEFILVGLNPGNYHVAVVMDEAYYLAEMVVESGNNSMGTITLIKGE
jgi:hypothetical protein